VDLEYEIVIGDDLESDVLVAEIWIGPSEPTPNQRSPTFAVIFEPPPYTVHIYPHPDASCWEIPLELMQEAVAAAKERLQQIQRG
jgi:hypothetical protein